MAFWKRRLRKKHISLAKSERFMFSARQLPSSPRASLSRARALYRKLGIRERTKLPTKTVWARMGTMLPWCALWPSDWDSRSTSSKASTRWHELVHGLQWRAGWFGRYAFAEWRWALEMNGYRMSIRAYKRMGTSEKNLLRLVEHYASKIVKTYRLRRLDAKQVQAKTREILRAEALR